jgi:putative FmdB family regulatory protein
MPIRRTYACPECNHFMEVTLSAEQWDDPPPSCPACDEREMQQRFKAPGIVNSSPHSRAQALTEDILANDYHVSDIQRDRHRESRPKVRYKDSTPSQLPSNWNTITAPAAMETALAVGRQNRLEFGSGLDVLQANLRSGAQADLVEVSKKRSAKIW